MINFQAPLQAEVSREEYKLLLQLREIKPAQHPPQNRISVGDRIADKIAATMGSWRFIIIQSFLLALWVFFNFVALFQHWDPYPFILLNLLLSFQAAYAAPIIMMSQNRQATIDRLKAKNNYDINVKAELEIELLHDKLNLLKEQEFLDLKKMLLQQQQKLQRLEELLFQQNN